MVCFFRCVRFLYKVFFHSPFTCRIDFVGQGQIGGVCQLQLILRVLFGDDAEGHLFGFSNFQRAQIDRHGIRCLSFQC